MMGISICKNHSLNDISERPLLQNASFKCKHVHAYFTDYTVHSQRVDSYYFYQTYMGRMAECA